MFIQKVRANRKKEEQKNELFPPPPHIQRPNIPISINQSSTAGMGIRPPPSAPVGRFKEVIPDHDLPSVSTTPYNFN